MRLALLPVLFLLGCRASAINYEGRPCSDLDPCGGGTLCDPVKRVCVKAGPGSSDGQQGRETSPPAGDQRGEGSLRDGPRADQPGGCGSGPRCAAGQSCISGNCTCVAGGACAGCCAGDACLAISSQAPERCGQKGQACGSCNDKNECTTDSCLNGVCGNKALSDGVRCAAGTCQSGVCSGCQPDCTGKSCGPDGCGGSCGPCSFTCISGVCCPQNCGHLGYYTGSVRGCTFDGSNGCTCPGTELNDNNVCDPTESCWGWDKCSAGNHNPANCHTVKSLNLPVGCTWIGSSCMDCS